MSLMQHLNPVTSSPPLLRHRGHVGAVRIIVKVAASWLAVRSHYDCLVQNINASEGRHSTVLQSGFKLRILVRYSQVSSYDCQ